MIIKYLHNLIYNLDDPFLGSGLFLTYEYKHENTENACTSLTPGIIVKIHPADEIPNFLHDVHTVQSNEFQEIIQFELRPQITKISGGLAKVTPEL